MENGDATAHVRRNLTLHIDTHTYIKTQANRIKQINVIENTNTQTHSAMHKNVSHIL